MVRPRIDRPRLDRPRLVRRRLVVHGRVQGVSFRAGCADVARRAEVSGWVANQPDGTVVAVLEGEAAAVDQVVRWCHDGPSLARVDDVDVTDEAVEGLHGFEQR